MASKLRNRLDSIEGFKASMRSGFARPNLFRVRVGGAKKATTSPSALRHFQHTCFQAQIPGNNILTTDKDIGFRSIAYQKAFSDIILGFYVGDDLRELELWQQWIYDIAPQDVNKMGKGFKFNYYENYVGSIEITKLNRKQQPVTTWKLHEAYPKQVDPIQLDYGTNDAVMTCSVTITYRYFEIGVDHITNEPQVEQGAEPQYTRSVQTEKNKADRIENVHGADDAWKFGNNGRITENDFYASYPNWDDMNHSEQQAAYKVYGVDKHGFSPVGGASNMVAEQVGEE